MPEGAIRRFHVTSASRLPGIIEHGLTMENARGIEGPRGIYSWATFMDADSYGAGPEKAVIEFHDDPLNYRWHPYASTKDVSPVNILAVHLPWHDICRYVKDALAGGDMDILDRLEGLANDIHYGPVYQRLQLEGVYQLSAPRT